ncbi:MAG: hypothetical protein LBJ92_02440 [Holosporales bacterium]|jgi:protein-disulfide isomerase|nr:hypothetical protein [Holosporales bacterium]
MENKGPGCGCGKFSAVLSVLALMVAAASYYFSQKKVTTAPQEDSIFEERVRNVVIDIVKQNPQLLMDAMGEGIAKKREDSLKQLSVDTFAKRDELDKLSMKFGKLDSKNVILCFFDPLCKHCIAFQKSMLALIQSGADICFKLLPVSVLGEDSVTVAKVYFAVYSRSSEKAKAFIEAITADDGTMDKDGIEKALKAVGISLKDIEGLMTEADAKLIANGRAAESLKIPVVPAIFYIHGLEIKMIQSTNVDQILQVTSGAPEEAPRELDAKTTQKPAA